MYIIPNMIIYRHHYNGLTYNTKTEKKNASLPVNHPQTLCNSKCVKGGVLGKNSNTHQKNDSNLPDISLKNTIRKPSLRKHPEA